MFENLSKKLTDFGTVAANRTKNIGDRVSLTAKIEAAKRELTGIYAQLGQQVYQNQQADIPEEYAELFEKIAKTEQTLEDYQAQRQVLRRVRPCPDCGADVPNDAEFCSKCGCHVGVVEEAPADTDEEDDFFEAEEDLTKEAPAEETAEGAPAEASSEEAPAEE